VALNQFWPFGQLVCARNGFLEPPDRLRGSEQRLYLAEIGRAPYSLNGFWTAKPRPFVTRYMGSCRRNKHNLFGLTLDLNATLMKYLKR
jgi:hypothetical protein